MDEHTNWFIIIIVAAVFAVVGGLMASVIVFSDGPGLVYDPQVVHRTITTDDGRHVDCAVSDSGMSCDWTHPQ